jgi:rare lipoprotein A
LRLIAKFAIIVVLLIISSNPGAGTEVNIPLIARDYLKSRYNSEIENVDNNLLSYESCGDMVATWYGNQFHGRKTSSGDVFDQDGLTAAHKTLPFGTLLKLTNPKNNKSIIVRVNDRPGFKSTKRVDLSRGAAKALDMIRAGRVKLKVEIVKVNYNSSYIALK